MHEFSAKVEKVKEFMASRELDAIYLARQDNFSWLTGGRSSLVNISSELGTAALVLTQDKSYLLTDRIEEPLFTTCNFGNTLMEKEHFNHQASSIRAR